MRDNDFSPTWYAVFMDPMPAAAADAETVFVARHLPPTRFRRVLDVCCGTGRHAAPFAALGYEVYGIDQNAAAIATAQGLALPHATFAVHDMRRIAALPGPFDGAVNLWHSFGYFDDATNADVLRQIHDALVPGGRFVLDIYNRDALLLDPLMQQTERQGKTLTTRYIWNDRRLRCELDYGDGNGDSFEWRLYTPDEIRDIAADVGFRCLAACAWYDERLAPSPEHKRMQFVFERTNDE